MIKPELQCGINVVPDVIIRMVLTPEWVSTEFLL